MGQVNGSKWETRWKIIVAMIVAVSICWHCLRSHLSMEVYVLPTGHHDTKLRAAQPRNVR